MPRGFGRFWAAATLSDFGTAVTALALPVLVLTGLGGSTADVGVVNGARFLAYPLLGLLVGPWIDRRRRRPVLVATDVGRAVLLAVICVLALSARLDVPLLVGLIAVFGLLSLGNDAAAQSLLPRLVSRSELVRANARLEQSTALAQTAGPALAGLLIRSLSAPLALLVDAVSYLVSGLVTTRIAVDEQPVRPEQIPSRRDRPRWRAARNEIAEGLRWVYRHPTLGPLGLNTHAWFLCWAVLSTVQVSFALRTLGFSALTLGIVLALGGAATVAGTSAAERLVRRWGEGRVIAVSRFGYGPGALLLVLAPTAHGPAGVWPAVTLVVASQLLIGVCFGAEGPAEISYRQAVTPDRLQGRTNTTLRSVNRAMVVIGAPIGGLLADRAGPRVALTAAAVGFLVVAVAFSVTKAAAARFVPRNSD